MSMCGMFDAINKGDAKKRYGATEKDLANIPNSRNYCGVGRYELIYKKDDLERALTEKYGSVAECQAQAEVRRANAQYATDQRLASPPKGWPNVGCLLGCEDWAAVALQSASGRVVDLGLVLVRGGRVVADLSTIVNPGPMPAHGMWCHNQVYTVAMVADAPPAAEVWAAYLKATDGAPIAMYHSEKDQAQISAELSLAGLPVSNSISYSIRTSERVKHISRFGNTDGFYYHLFRRHVPYPRLAAAEAAAIAAVAPRLEALQIAQRADFAAKGWPAPV